MLGTDRSRLITCEELTFKDPVLPIALVRILSLYRLYWSFSHEYFSMCAT